MLIIIKMLTITKLVCLANCCNWTFDFTLSWTASQVNPDDVLKLENQRAESVLDDSGDISEDEECEGDEQAELTDNEQESGGSEAVEEDENDTDLKMKESDEDSTPASNKKAKMTQKPRGAEYKLIR